MPIDLPPPPATTRIVMAYEAPGAATSRGRIEAAISASNRPAVQDETEYLLSSPENARKLLAAIARLENGGGTVRDLLDPDD